MAAWFLFSGSIMMQQLRCPGIFGDNRIRSRTPRHRYQPVTAIGPWQLAIDVHAYPLNLSPNAEISNNVFVSSPLHKSALSKTGRYYPEKT